MDKKSKIVLGIIGCVILILVGILFIPHDKKKNSKSYNYVTSNGTSISIDRDTIHVGDTIKIKYTTMSGNNISFESSDTNIITIDSEGIITGISVGRAKVLIKENDKLIKEFEINVVEDNVIIEESKSNTNSNSNEVSNSNIESNTTSNKESNSNTTSNNQNSNKESNTSNSNQKSNKPSNSNTVERSYKATFIAIVNGKEVNSESVSCNTNLSSCTITTPNMQIDGYILEGYSLTKLSNKVDVGVGKTYTLNGNKTLYAVLKKTYKYTATFDMSNCEERVNGNTYTTGCDPKSGYSSCTIKTPKCTMYGVYDGFWKNLNLAEPKGVNSAIPENTNLTIYKDGSFAPYTGPFDTGTGNPSKARNFNIKTVYKLGNVTIEYENGLSDKVINNHKAVLDKYYKNVPFLFKRNIDIFVLTIPTYESYSIAYGLTIPTNYDKAYIDLKYDAGLDGISENATLHEMSHAWDSYYNYRTGNGRISAQTNMVNFYESLGETKRNKLSRLEWFAGLFTEWYWHYKGYDTSKPSYAGYKDNYNYAEKVCTQKLFNCYSDLANNDYNGSCSNISC